MSQKIAAAILLLALTLPATSGQAGERQLPARAASMVGQYIAQQGNAALVQLRTELRNELRAALRPLLPDLRSSLKPAPTLGADVELATAR